MTLYHWTPGVNVPSILRWGLLTRYSHCDPGVVYVFTKSHIDRLCGHIADRHRTLPGLCCLIQVDVPRSWVANRWDGIYVCNRNIPAERVKLCQASSKGSMAPA